MGARAKLPEILKGLMRSELETAIYQSALHTDDELIAKRYIIDKWAQIDIAAELGWERTTVSRHLKSIIKAVEDTAEKLYR